MIKITDIEHSRTEPIFEVSIQFEGGKEYVYLIERYEDAKGAKFVNEPKELPEKIHRQIEDIAMENWGVEFIDSY